MLGASEKYGNDVICVESAPENYESYTYKSFDSYIESFYKSGKAKELNYPDYYVIPKYIPDTMQLHDIQATSEGVSMAYIPEDIKTRTSGNSISNSMCIFIWHATANEEGYEEYKRYIDDELYSGDVGFYYEDVKYTYINSPRNEIGDGTDEIPKHCLFIIAKDGVCATASCPNWYDESLNKYCEFEKVYIDKNQ